MSQLPIRAATPADIRAIAQFQTDCWREAYRGLVPDDYLDRVDVASREARWGERLASGHRAIALAEVDGAMVGVVSWSDGKELDVTELKTLYLAAHYRGTGLADRLLLHAIGAAPAYLWVFEQNGRARAFYARHDFHPDGCHQVDPDTGVPELRYVRG